MCRIALRQLVPHFDPNGDPLLPRHCPPTFVSKVMPLQIMYRLPFCKLEALPYR